jgi:hypothetical protein
MARQTADARRAMQLADARAESATLRHHLSMGEAQLALGRAELDEMRARLAAIDALGVAIRAGAIVGDLADTRLRDLAVPRICDGRPGDTIGGADAA